MNINLKNSASSEKYSDNRCECILSETHASYLDEFKKIALALFTVYKYDNPTSSLEDFFNYIDSILE